jgi:hypothetical protein
MMSPFVSLEEWEKEYIRKVTHFYLVQGGWGTVWRYMLSALSLASGLGRFVERGGQLEVSRIRLC